VNFKSVSRIAVLFGVLAVGSLLVDTARAMPERVSLTGWVTCTTCLAFNACKAQTRLSCTLSGVSQGASYMLVVGDKHYLLSGLEKELAKAAAESSVTVTGDLTGNQLSVVGVDWPSKKRRER